MIKNEKKLIIPLVLVLLVVIVGTSYALWQVTLKQSGTNVITTGCFKLTLDNESDAVNLDNVFPISNEEGHDLDPYTFTITNTCNKKTSYIINLETLSNGDKIIPDKFLKTSLIANDEEIFLDTLRARFVNQEKVIEEATTAFKLYDGFLEGNSSETFILRLWMDENTPARDDVMNATWQGKITIIASYVEPLNMANMMIARWDDGIDEEYKNEDNDNFKDFVHSKQIIFENKIHDIDSIIPIDISKNKENTVLAYVDDRNPDNIITYIQANGTILFPEDSSRLFSGFENLTTITGLENVNTSYVTNMYSMFAGNDNLTDLNLSGFDVSNVIDAQDMFMHNPMIKKLDLSNWKFSENTMLDGMFNDDDYYLKGNVNLNLSGWDVTKIDIQLFFTELLTSVGIETLDLSNWYVNPDVMEGIWVECSASSQHIENMNLSNWEFTRVIDNIGDLVPYHRVINLDLSGWDTSMISTFSGAFLSEYDYEFNNVFSYLESLNLSGWDTTYVKDMSFMFFNLDTLKSLNISSFDTSSVENLRNMFDGCSNLTNIIYGSKFIYNGKQNIESMFEGCPANKPLDASWNGVF